MDNSLQQQPPEEKDNQYPAHADHKNIWPELKSAIVKITLTAFCFALIEGVAWLLWHEEDQFYGFFKHLVHWFCSCLILGGPISVALALWKPRRKLIGVSYFIVCCLLALISFKTPQSPTKTQSTGPTIEQQINRFAKEAIARNWQPPELPADAPSYPNGDKLVKIKLGGMTMTWPAGSESTEFTPPRPGPIIMPGGLRIIEPYVKNNRVYVKAQTPTGSPAGTVQLNDEWPPDIPAGWDRNFNANTFEIVDNTQIPVFQIRYDSANRIEVYGIFVAPNGAVTVAFGDETETAAPGQTIPDIPERKAWFVYPSDRHLGELALN
jgi:hypothetical protein